MRSAAADAADAALAATQLASLLRDFRRALNSKASAEERKALLEEIRERANELRDSTALAAIMQRYPPIAIIYGAWTVGCLGGELRSASTETSGTCLDRQMTAWDNMVDTISGAKAMGEAQKVAICELFRTAVRKAASNQSGTTTRTMSARRSSGREDCRHARQ
ncbi:MAG: hypothetical protein R3D30_10495 [Hyphomicrobiales bacterium]